MADAGESTPEVQLRETLGTELGAALRSARGIGRGVPPDLEPLVRQYAHASRVSGLRIEQTLIAVKALVRESTGDHADVFTPRVVGWAVAGYYHGSAR